MEKINIKKILVISWFFPPVNSSEGIVTFKLLRNSKQEYVVFTQQKNTSWSYGNEEYNLEWKNVERVFSNTDNFEKWTEEVVSYYKSHKGEFNVIMSRSMPPESHVAAKKIKEIDPKIKWIASFGDPIANNPYTLLANNVISPFSWNREDITKRNILRLFFPPRILKNIYWKFKYAITHGVDIKKTIKFQQEVFNKADSLIFNNEQQMRYMLKDQPDFIASKGIVLSHSFDDKLYPVSTKFVKRNKKIEMSFIGHCDSIRTPLPLLQAIKKLKETDLQLKNKLLIKFYGNLGNSDQLFIIDNYLTEVVEYRGSVGYIESLKLMKNSDWLILIDASLYSLLDENIFFAAKLADYIGSSNNVIGITMLNGASADIIRGYGGIVCSHSVEDILNYLYLIIYKDYKHEINYEYRNKLNAKYISNKFDDLIETLLLNN